MRLRTVTVDVEAVKGFRLAAEQGNTEAQSSLGRMYATGEGVPEKCVQAYKGTNLAAAQGHQTAIKNKEVLRK